MKRVLFLLALVLAASAALYATTLPLLTEQVRGNTSAVQAVSGAPSYVTLSLVASTWTTDTVRSHVMSLAIVRCFTTVLDCDTNNTWQPVASAGFVNGPVLGKGGAMPSLQVHFDGVASIYRGDMTVNTPFSWGLNATF